jgi:hypothetical protein
VKRPGNFCHFSGQNSVSQLDSASLRSAIRTYVSTGSALTGSACAPLVRSELGNL